MTETVPADVTPTLWTKADLLAIAFAMGLPTIVTLVYFLWLKDADPLIQQVAMGGGKVIQFGFPITWVWLRHRDKLKRRRPAAGPSSLANNLLIGIAFGAMVVVALYAIYFLFLAPTETGATMAAMVEEKVTGLGIDSIWKFIGLSLAYAFLHTFMEEYYWRWFVFDFLDHFVSTPVANIVSSLGFMAHHVVVLAVYFGWSHPLTYAISFCVAIGGSFWCWQFKRTGTMLVPWFSHCLVDAGIFSLGYLLIKGVLA